LFRRDIQPTLDHIGIGEGSPTAGASGARPFTAGGSATSTSRTSLPAAEACAYRDNRPLAEVDVELVLVPIGYGALLVIDGGLHDAAGRLHGAGLGDVNQIGHGAGDGKRGAGLNGDQQAAVTDELFQIG